MDKPLSTFSKIVLLGAGALAVVAGPILYLFPNDTETYFAWTIQHPLTPVYMGASYFAGIGNLLAIRVNKSSLARVQVPAIIVFSLLMLVATLLHIPIFNWSHPIAWAWLAVYVISPIAAVIVFLQIERGYKAPEFESNKLPAVFSPVMLTFAFIDGMIGLALFFFPEQAAPLWAWSLTPLTARVIGGWWLSGAVLQFMLARQKTLHTARVGLFATILVTALLLIGALLHFEEFNGPQISIWLYLLLTLLLGGFSVYSWIGSRSN
ncbi:MAG TPA: hypothetical protein VJM08_07855 [Anaerolineales bacterium]|nr:hypothetical protein [Anaerolineales bacterium]